MTQASLLWTHGVMIAVSLLAGLVGYANVQAPTIPIHFKLDGTPDRFAPALAGFFGLPIGGMLLLALSFWIASQTTSTSSSPVTTLIPAFVQLVLTAGQFYIVYRGLRA